MKTIAFFNVKGGVGKTTSAVNFAYLAAQAGLKTLVWDLDPQSCASWYLGVDDEHKHKALNVFKGKEPIGKLRLQSAYPNLQVIPADLSLRKLELLLSNNKNPKRLLEKLADNLSEQNSLLIFDCAPAFSKLSENVFNCSDILLVPLLPSPLSLRSYQQLKTYIAAKKQWKQLKLVPFFTMVDRRRKVHNQVLDDAKALIGTDQPLVVPYNSELEKMGVYRQPVYEFCNSGPGADAYRNLWQYANKKYHLL